MWFVFYGVLVVLAWGEAWGAALSEPSPLPSVRMPRLLSDTFIGGHELRSHPLESLHNETQTRHRCTRQTHEGGNGSGQGTPAPSPRLGLTAGSKTRAPRARGELRPLAPAWMQRGGRGQTEPPTQQQAQGTGHWAWGSAPAWRMVPVPRAVPGLAPGIAEQHRRLPGAPQRCAARAGCCAPR